MPLPLSLECRYEDLLRARYRTVQAAHYAAFLKTQDALGEKRPDPGIRTQWEQARLDLSIVRGLMGLYAEGTEALCS